MKSPKSLVSCSSLFLCLISLHLFAKCIGKSRASSFPYRRFVPGASTPWRSYGGGYGGVLGGIGGEYGDLGLSYRSSRNTEKVETWPYTQPKSPAQMDLRSTRDINYWSSYSKPSYTCEYSCDDGTCLSKEYWCDGYAHCWDGSDEKTCTCKDKIGDAKICDGYKDCPDGADEKDCVYGCQANEFTCDMHNTGSRVTCVALTKRCDGKMDCPQGNDEHDCFRMVDLFDDEQRGVMSKGILQKRLGDDQWHTVCKTSTASQHITLFAEKACEQIIGHVDGTINVVTKSLSQMKQQMSKQQVQLLKYIRLAEIESKFAVLGQCASDLVYEVTCPPPQCGGYGNYGSYERRRRRSVDEVEEDSDNEELEDEEEDDEFDFEEEEEDDAERELIVGGYATHEMQWPFLVGIFRDGEFYCGGSIINDEWVLTAAHCCHGYDKHVFEVQAGMTRRLSWSPYEQTRMVKEIYVHEEYNSKVFANDIALYKLDKPLHLSKYVTPACLPASSADDPVGGQGCKVAGWGDLSESGSGPDHMQEVELPILSKCQETFTRDTHQICAGYTEGGKDACQGDSGGPLMCVNSAGKQIVNGVVSFGRGCARAHEAGAYTRVSAYEDWINKVISGKLTQGAYYPRPKQCTEKCFKPGGECIYPDEKCSGKVECLGAEDELSCTHPMTRTHGDHSTSSTTPYWSSYPAQPQQNYYTPTSSQQQQYGMISRSRQPSEPAYYPVPLPPPPPAQQSPYPFLLGRANIRPMRKSIGDCNPSEFQCATKIEGAHLSLSQCLQSNMQCDRSMHCPDKSDEINCMTVTTNFREAAKQSSLMHMNEVKGYVLTRYQGNEWHPLVSDTFTLAEGVLMCQTITGLDSAKLKSLETIQIEELANLMKKQGVDLLRGKAVMLERDVNEDDDQVEVESSSSGLLSTSNKMFGHPGQLATVNLHRDVESNVNEAKSSAFHLTADKISEMSAVFVRCLTH